MCLTLSAPWWAECLGRTGSALIHSPGFVHRRPIRQRQPIRPAPRVRIMTEQEKHWRWAGAEAVPAEAAAGTADPGIATAPPPAVLTARARWRAALSDRLPPTLQGRWALDRTTGIVLAVSVLLGALLIGGWTVLRARPHELAVARGRDLASPPGPVPDIGVATGAGGAPMGAGGAGPGSYAAAGAAGAPATPGASAAGVVVDVEGKVAKPGVRTLPAGSRVIDALDAAGGALPGTDLSTLNQAQVLVDGQQVLVGIAPPPPAPGATPGRGGKGKGRAGAGGAEPVRLNSAGVEDLEQLPGIGPALAQRVVDYRTAHGPFASVEDLRQVSGLRRAALPDDRPAAGALGAPS